LICFLETHLCAYQGTQMQTGLVVWIPGGQSQANASFLENL
jgi:hypothetical protein